MVNPSATKRTLAGNYRTYSLEKLWYMYGGKCHICKKRISSIDDASRDHKLPACLGGRYTWVNLRLAHKLCNNRRGRLYGSLAQVTWEKCPKCKLSWMFGVVIRCYADPQPFKVKDLAASLQSRRKTVARYPKHRCFK